MTTTTTAEQIKAIISALARLHVSPFGCESGDPRTNAQRNLRGKTHYVDDETLRWHHSRIIRCNAEHGGLLLCVTCSDALDPRNTRRGFRTVVFDCFGDMVSRPKLEEAKSTARAALNASAKEPVDLLAHYREALMAANRRLESSQQEHQAALSQLAA